MPGRILFACAICDAALAWPVQAIPCADDAAFDEGSFKECRDGEGNSVVELHGANRWKAKLEPSGVVTCPEGHTVGVRHLNGHGAPGRLVFLRDRVTSRVMRGRV